MLGLRAAQRIALIYGFTRADKARIHRFAIGSAARENLRKCPGHGREQEVRKCYSSARPKARDSLHHQLRRCRDG